MKKYLGWCSVACVWLDLYAGGAMAQDVAPPVVITDQVVVKILEQRECIVGEEAGDSAETQEFVLGAGCLYLANVQSSNSGAAQGEILLHHTHPLDALEAVFDKDQVLDLKVNGVQAGESRVFKVFAIEAALEGMFPSIYTKEVVRVVENSNCEYVDKANRVQRCTQKAEYALHDEETPKQFYMHFFKQSGARLKTLRRGSSVEVLLQAVGKPYGIEHQYLISTIGTNLKTDKSK